MTLFFEFESRVADAGGEDSPGGTHAPLRRVADYRYADGIGEMVSGLPSAREISNAVAQQSADIPSTAGHSDFLWMWGQFLDHDISLTEAVAGGEAADIAVPTGDPFFDPMGTGDAVIDFTRVTPIEGTGETEPRAYENEITAFIDGSNVYGSTEAQAALVRDAGGKIRLDAAGLIFQDDAGATVAGDVRAFENVGLASIHSLFAREHNRIVDEIRDDVIAANPGLSGEALDDRLYDEARIRVEAILQAITFNEFLPKLVGEDAFDAYQGYDSAVDPQISVEFSTAIYRLGHTMLSSELQRLDEAGDETAGGHLALRDAFFRPDKLTEEGIDPLLRGAASAYSQEIDAFVVEDVRSFLFGPPGAGGFDLVSLNIQRGRDLGVAAYNDLREAFGLERKATFLEVTGGDADIAAKLASVYHLDGLSEQEAVDLIDPWIGGISEAALPDGVLGELFSVAVVDQFSRLRDGDPFWSESRGFSQEELDALWDTKLSDVILRNTDITHLQDDVFETYIRQGGSDRRDFLRGGDERDLLIGFDGADRLMGYDGDDHLFGDEGRDFLDGGDGDDVLIGGLDADRLMGGADDDRLEGGHGRDNLNGGDGDDTLLGGDDADVLSGGDGVNILTGGGGRDRFMFYGSDHTETTITDFEAGDLLYFMGSQEKGGVTLAQLGDDVTATVGDYLFVLLEDVSVALVADNAMFA